VVVGWLASASGAANGREGEQQDREQQQTHAKQQCGTEGEEEMKKQTRIRQLLYLLCLNAL